jgi:TB2/DP1, HVA22 family
MHNVDSLVGESRMLTQIEERSSVPRRYVTFGLLILSVIFVLVCLGQSLSFVSTLVGVLYPAYMSIKAVENKSATMASDDYTQWLNYWIVFSSFTVSYVPTNARRRRLTLTRFSLPSFSRSSPTSSYFGSRSTGLERSSFWCGSCTPPHAERSTSTAGCCEGRSCNTAPWLTASCTRAWQTLARRRASTRRGPRLGEGQPATRHLFPQTLQASLAKPRVAATQINSDNDLVEREREQESNSHDTF